MWFVFALVSTLGWGCADLFYKKSSAGEDRYSHLRIAVWVGLVMGIAALALLPFSESGFDLPALVSDAVRYAPASISYIVSMIIGYAGMRYLELSVISPIQNASGALSCIVIVNYMLITGQISSISEEISPLDGIGTVLIVLGCIALAFAEKSLSAAEDKLEAPKYRLGALALLFPILYCVFDTIGTSADGIILDEETGLGLGEIDVLILYGLTFFVAGIVCWIYLLIREGRPYQPFRRSEWPKAAAALSEEFGQIFYVYAMAARPAVAAPMIASYCIVSVLLSRLFLGEKLELRRAVPVVTVIAGIVLLGLSEGFAA